MTRGPHKKTVLESWKEIGRRASASKRRLQALADEDGFPELSGPEQRPIPIPRKIYLPYQRPAGGAKKRRLHALAADGNTFANAVLSKLSLGHEGDRYARYTRDELLKLGRGALREKAHEYDTDTFSTYRPADINSELDLRADALRLMLTRPHGTGMRAIMMPHLSEIADRRPLTPPELDYLAMLMQIPAGELQGLSESCRFPRTARPHHQRLCH